MKNQMRESAKLTYSPCRFQKMASVPTSRLQSLWNSPAGPKTVFFWAPLFKWSVHVPSSPFEKFSAKSHFGADLVRFVSRGLVAAGLKDLSRPAEVISIPQNLGELSLSSFAKMQVPH